MNDPAKYLGILPKVAADAMAERDRLRAENERLRKYAEEALQIMEWIFQNKDERRIELIRGTWLIVGERLHSLLAQMRPAAHVDADHPEQHADRVDHHDQHDGVDENANERRERLAKRDQRDQLLDRPNNEACNDTNDQQTDDGA